MVLFLLVAFYFLAGTQSQDIATGGYVGGRFAVVKNDQSVNWFTARDSCMSEGMTLLEIYNARENMEAHNLLTEYEVQNSWIGGNDLDAEDQYQWMNGTIISEMFWSPDSHDNKGGSKDCMTITSDEMLPNNWIDRECENTYAYICMNTPKYKL